MEAPRHASPALARDPEASAGPGGAAVWAARLFAAAILITISLRHLAKTRSRPRGWEIGDWLISYAGGFVRRGLLGEVAIRIRDASGLTSPAALWTPLLLLQLGCYVLLFAAAVRLLELAPRYRPFLFLFYSPAFLSFPLLTVGGGFRKEILHFGLFSAGCLALLPGASRAARTAVALAIPLLIPVFVLSHEMLFVTVPCYLVLGWLLLRPGVRPGTFGAWAAAVVLLATGAMALAMAHPGTGAQGNRICAAVLDRGLRPSVCRGAIGSIGTSVEEARAAVAALAGVPGFAWRCLAGLALALAPLALAFRDLWRTAEVGPRLRLATAGLAASALVTVPVLVVAVDWGRFVHVHVVTATLLVLALSARWPEDLRAAAGRGWRAGWAGPRALAAALVLHASAWHLTHLGPLLGPSVVEIARAEWFSASPAASRGLERPAQEESLAGK